MTDFINRLWQFISQPPKLIFVVEVKALGSKSELVLTCLHQKKSKLEVVNFFVFKSIEEIKKKVGKEQTVVWVYNTIELLVHVSDKTSETPLNTAFPNLNITDFFLEKHHNFYTLCRKKNIKELELLIKKNNLPFSCIFLGLSPLIARLEMFGSPLDLTNFSIEHENGNLKTIDRKERPSNPEMIRITEGFTTSNQSLIGLYAAISFLELNNRSSALQSNGDSDIKNSFGELKKKRVNAFKNHLLQRRILRYAFPLLFLLLMINFGFQIFFQSQLEALEQENQIYSVSQKKISLLQKDLDEKVSRIEKYSSFTHSNVSFYLDSILINLPESLLLKSFIYQPLEGRISSESIININSNTIEIDGELSQKNDFDLWIDQLRQLGWITKVNLIQYGTLKGRKMNFKIEIILDNAS